MKASRNTARVHRNADVSSLWQDAKEWVKRNITNERVAEVVLSFATAASLCYLGSRMYVALQNYAMYAY